MQTIANKNEARAKTKPTGSNQGAVDIAHKTRAKIKYLNIMTKTANAIDFFKKMSFHAKDKTKKFIIRPKTPAIMLIVASLNLSK